MKIALVFDGLGFGGIERVGIDYIKVLQELGHEIDVYNLNPNADEMVKDIPDGCKVKNHYFSQKLCPELYSYGVKKWWWGKYAYPLIFAVLSILLEIRKLINKHRNEKYDVAIAFSGHFNDLTFVAYEFIKTDKKMCWLHGALYGYLLIADGYINLYRKNKNLIVLVDDAQEEVLQYNKFLDLNINKLYNPTYITKRKPNDKKVSELYNEYGDFILMVSRFAYPHKDHYTVVDAIRSLKEVYQLKVNAVFVGDGPEFEKVKEYCKKCNVEDQIFLVGSKSDVENYYLASKLLVHASVAGEGLPTIILEALSFGKPVVVTDSKVGPREILGNDEYGLLSRVKDGADMAKQINRLLTNKQLYDHYILKGYERIKDFQPDVIGKQLQYILKNLV